VFRDVLDEEPYDLVVADEAWDVDYFLHENPQVKRAPLAWMTDFVGWLPMPEGGDAEAALTADYNAEMIEQRARFRAVRDRSVFVGNEADVVDASFGPGLPRIRDWTSDNFDYAGYVTGFEPIPPEARPALREALGYREDERVCVVTVGGSGVGGPLLRRVLDAVPLVRAKAEDLRFVLVTGPRIDPESLASVPGVDVRGFLPDLVDHLAVCDVAIVQGGLSTTMELTANRRPFVYVPLRNHFEQNLHVRHRLERYGAGTCLEYDVASDPDALADAVVTELDRVVDYKPVETDGAARAAALIGSLL
jgi:predicted glycosyltransferase